MITVVLTCFNKLSGEFDFATRLVNEIFELIEIHVYFIFRIEIYVYFVAFFPPQSCFKL